jgi:hypothetical protein
VETVGPLASGLRAPTGVRIEDVIAVQKGAGDQDRVVIVQGHIDSRVNDVMDATTQAPGANDDASGVALVMEAARLLSKEECPAAIVYAVLSGEEQGLLGRQAAGGHRQGTRLEARGRTEQRYRRQHARHRGEHVDDRVRVFSEDIEADADAAGVKQQRAIGGEDDSASRALAKAIVRVAAGNKRVG